MDVLATVKDDIYQPAVDSVMGIPSALKETFTTKKKATSVGWAMGGLVGASVIGAGLTMLPLGRLPFGNGIGNFNRCRRRSSIGTYRIFP